MSNPTTVLASLLKQGDITTHEHDEALLFTSKASVLLVAYDKPMRDEAIGELVEAGMTVQPRILGNIFLVAGYRK